MTESVLNKLIDTFYELKEKYESAKRVQVRQIISNKDLSARQKRAKFIKMEKPKCVNCGRAVGTIFTITRKDKFRVFAAKCGDLENPCPLDIKFSVADRIKYQKSIKEGQEQINNVKTDIIMAKNDMLFNYIDADANTIFTELTNQLEELSEETGEIIENNILINDNPETKQLLNSKQKHFVEDVLSQYNEIVDEFKVQQSSDIDFQILAEYYVDDIMPAATEIRKLKYQQNFVECDKENTNKMPICMLVQQNNPSNQYYFNKDHDKIFSNVVGVFVKNTKSKTMSVPKSRKNITRKLRIVEE